MGRFDPDFDVAVVGAGVIGLACAEALASSGHSVVVLERHARFAQETSSRNSGVVHAGIYYPADSLKARLCLRGRLLLTERAKSGHFQLRQVGKLIVATTEEELARLEVLQRNAAAAGVHLSALDAPAVRRLEPAVHVVAALLSPQSGIVDVHALCGDYLRGALAAGATFAPKSEVIGLERDATGWRVRTRQPDGTEFSASTRWIVNAAGLRADHIARLAGVDVDGLGLVHSRCKGSYFTVTSERARTVSHLVYPLPQAAGLGIHLTPDLAGGLRAGPDAEYVESDDLAVDETKRTAFAQAVGRYFAGVRPEDLVPAYAGIRPKLAGPGAPFRDFAIRHEAEIGLPGLINLLGIESPGLTASPAIAELVSWIVSAGGPDA